MTKYFWLPWLAEYALRRTLEFRAWRPDQESCLLFESISMATLPMCAFGQMNGKSVDSHLVNGACQMKVRDKFQRVWSADLLVVETKQKNSFHCLRVMIQRNQIFSNRRNLPYRTLFKEFVFISNNIDTGIDCLTQFPLETLQTVSSTIVSSQRINGAPLCIGLGRAPWEQPMSAAKKWQSPNCWENSAIVLQFTIVLNNGNSANRFCSFSFQFYWTLFGNFRKQWNDQK